MLARTSCWCCSRPQRHADICASRPTSSAPTGACSGCCGSSGHRCARGKRPASSASSSSCRRPRYDGDDVSLLRGGVRYAARGRGGAGHRGASRSRPSGFARPALCQGLERDAVLAEPGSSHPSPATPARVLEPVTWESRSMRGRGPGGGAPGGWPGGRRRHRERARHQRGRLRGDEVRACRPRHNNIDHCARVCHAPSVAGLRRTLARAR